METELLHVPIVMHMVKLGGYTIFEGEFCINNLCRKRFPGFETLASLDTNAKQRYCYLSIDFRERRRISEFVVSFCIKTDHKYMMLINDN